MKIRAYKLTDNGGAAASSVLDSILALPLARRVKDTSFGEISLKEVRKSNNFYALDFTNFRITGPGKAPKDRPNEDFYLTDDEYFGEETAAIYFPKTADFIAQYNHFGPRSSSIHQYLNTVGSELASKNNSIFTPYVLDPVMNADYLARFRRMRHFKRTSFKMYVPGALQAPQAKRRSVSGILSDNILTSAETISVIIAAGRSKALSTPTLSELVTNLLKFPDDLTQLKVVGSEAPGASSSLVDLLGAQLQTERPIPASRKKRDGLAERWTALRSAYDDWKQQGVI